MFKRIVAVAVVGAALTGGSVLVATSGGVETSAPQAPRDAGPEGEPIKGPDADEMGDYEKCRDNKAGPELCWLYREPPPGHRACTEDEMKGRTPAQRIDAPQCWVSWALTIADPDRAGPPRADPGSDVAPEPDSP